MPFLNEQPSTELLPCGSNGKDLQRNPTTGLDPLDAAGCRPDQADIFHGKVSFLHGPTFADGSALDVGQHVRNAQTCSSRRSQLPRIMRLHNVTFPAAVHLLNSEPCCSYAVHNLTEAPTLQSSRHGHWFSSNLPRRAMQSPGQLMKEQGHRTLLKFFACLRHGAHPSSLSMRKLGTVLVKVWVYCGGWGVGIPRSGELLACFRSPRDEVSCCSTSQTTTQNRHHLIVSIPTNASWETSVGSISIAFPSPQCRHLW